jgi:hypothetical protein
MTSTPAPTVIDVKAMMVPTKVELLPSVAELPTCQKTLQARAPFVRMTLLFEAVMSADETWKMKTAFGSPPAFRVSAPLMCSSDVAL